jgi:hypothetical protein
MEFVTGRRLGRISRGGLALPKVSLGPTMPTNLCPANGHPQGGVHGPSSAPLDTSQKSVRLVRVLRWMLRCLGVRRWAHISNFTLCKQLSFFFLFSCFTSKSHPSTSSVVHQLLPLRRISRGDHGLQKAFLVPAMPYPSTPCGLPPLKRPYSCYSGSHPQGRWPAAVFYPLRNPMPYASDLLASSGFNFKTCSWCRCWKGKLEDDISVDCVVRITANDINRRVPRSGRPC